MTRRRLLWLVGGAAGLAMAGIAWLRHVVYGGRGDREAPGESAAEARVPEEALPVLLAVADVIVPRHGDSPAASEIDFVARFETLLAASPRHARFYAQNLPGFIEAVSGRVPMPGGALDPDLLDRLCERWHADLRSRARPEPAARFFGVLRDDVVRIYYASPAGWAFAGFEGPAHWSADQLAANG